jgi:hypothetical protein
MDQDSVEELLTAMQVRDARNAEMRLTMQRLEREKEEMMKVLTEKCVTEQAKDAQIQQLSSLCLQLSNTNQTLIQDKATLLYQTKQATEWCQQLLQTNQNLRQDKTSLVEKYGKANAIVSSSSTAQQNTIEGLMRQKSVLIQYACEQDAYVEQLKQTNVQLSVENQDLKHKLLALER